MTNPKITDPNIRTRFAPSPTGYIHLGNIRSALYPWAFARHRGGSFILRIEDTDIDRSSQEAVDVILQGLAWLGMDFDEGPFYQTQRMDRYKQVIKDMLDNGLAYYCYTTSQELDILREQQKQAGEKPKYDGKWRPEEGKILPQIPNIPPVVRFKNPVDGIVTWLDCVKGEISISNSELDDFIIARADGVPTYNFCVVVDDIDMSISHVIRGDDHVNNTPRQINLLKALNKNIPIYAHLPTVLNEQGEKLSKRNSAMNIMSYAQEGYLPQAIVNYLARLGWSHGNDEIFSAQQFIEWFNLEHLGSSATQFNHEKLLWLNAHYIKNMENHNLLTLALPFLHEKNYNLSIYNTQELYNILDLIKDRASTLKELAEIAGLFFNKININNIDKDLLKLHIQENNKPALIEFINLLENIEENNWNYTNINQVFKQALTQYKLKMPSLAMPIRLLVLGTTQTPSIDKILTILGKQEVLSRLKVIVINSL